MQEQYTDADLYAVLGVPEDASAKDIHSAYKRLAKQFHPDANSGDLEAAERFKEISAAHDVLGDEDKRAEYDEFRSMMARGFPHGFQENSYRDGAYSGAGFGPGGFAGGADLNDLLGQMFSGGGAGGMGGMGGRPTMRHIARIDLDFADAVRGTELSLATASGETVTVRVPAGVDTGDQLLARTEDGEVIVEITVRPDARFGRDREHLTLAVPISLTEALLGGRIKVPTFDGKPVSLKVPAGTPHGRTFRVKGRGVTRDGRTGDLLVSVELVVPNNLTDEQREAVAAYAEVAPAVVHPNRL